MLLRRRDQGYGKAQSWEGPGRAGTPPAATQRRVRAIYKNVLGKTQAEAKAKLKQAIEKAKGLDAAKVGRYTVGQWMEVWFENYAKVKVRPSSHQTYRGYIDNHIKPNIGKKSLEKLTSLELQKFYKKLLTRQERIDWRANTRQRASAQDGAEHPPDHRLGHETGEGAENDLYQPGGWLRPAKVGTSGDAKLPVEQLQSFLREARDSGVFELYYLELATGLRRGELLGLKWEDIDLERGDLRVRRQIARINGEVVEAPLKTKNAYRTLPLAEDTIGVLEAAEEKTGAAASGYSPSTTGGPISPDSVLHMLHRVLKRAGLPKVRFHDLRHTFATLALQNGGGHQDGVRDAGTLQRGVHPGHLRPRDYGLPASGRQNDGRSSGW